MVAVGVSAQTVIKMASLVPQGSAWHSTLLEMGAAWQKASGGKVTLRLYPGGVAGDDNDVVRKMRLGTIDAGLLAVAGLADIDRSIFALSIPMAFTGYDELDAVMAKMTPQLDRVFAEKGFIVLAWADGGWVHFFSKDPMHTPDEMKRMKLFTWAGDPPAVEMWKSAGFNPVVLPSTEISTALQTGMINVLPTTPQAAVLLQWYNQARYLNDVNWAVLLGAMVINKAAWDRIPAEIQPAVRAAAENAGRTLRAQTREAAPRDIKAMVDRGLVVYEPDEATLALWRTAAEAAYPTVRTSFMPAWAFDEAMKVRAEVRAAAGKAK
jgi:TRAP-type C4-dicarboxylate transport system substrate-binding protein